MPSIDSGSATPAGVRLDDISALLARPGFRPVHDRGRVLTGIACAIAVCLSNTTGAAIDGLHCAELTQALRYRLLHLPARLIRARRCRWPAPNVDLDYLPYAHAPSGQ